MHAPSTNLLPDRLTAYAPGRITEVPVAAWPAALDGAVATGGVRTTIPRYGLDVYASDHPVVPDEVRAWSARLSVADASDLDVAVANHAGRLWVVGDRALLAAHLASGTQRIPVRIVVPTTQG